MYIYTYTYELYKQCNNKRKWDQKFEREQGQDGVMGRIEGKARELGELHNYILI